MGGFCIRGLPERMLFFFSDGGKQVPGMSGQCFVVLLIPQGHRTVEGPLDII